MTSGRALAGLGLAGLGLGLAAGSNSPAATSAASAAGQPVAVTFDFERQGLPVPHWAIDIQQDGSGHYDDLSHPNDPTAQTQRAIRVEAATRHRLDAGFDRVAAGKCEANIKNLANTGTKRIAYRRSGDVWVSCTFIYTEDKGLEDATTAFQAIAQTLQEGDQLEHSHRFDRLGLDAEIDELAKEVKEGEAIEVENIAPVLQSIAQDERVMERVRRKAARLLQDASPVAANESGS